ncbi:MAG: hypothetical protein MI976_00175 [Pseudomonadales bacterium]|nr:hypothetical protein [Pseudomonadales bacterium]
MRYLITLLGGLLCAYQAMANPTESDQNFYQVIFLSGSDIPTTIGKPIADLSLFAVKDGQLEPIPYQIDEYNIGGGVYFEQWPEEIDGTYGVMDSNDKFLALQGNAGPRLQPDMVLDGKVLAEIELGSNHKHKQYLYVVEGSRLQSERQHVRHSIEESRVETDFFSLTYQKENQFIWTDFNYRDYLGDSPIDGLKLAFETGILSSNATVSYDNKNFIGETIAENVGPIRTTAQLRLTFVLLGLDFVEGSIQLHYYPNGLVYDVRLIIPETRRAMLVDPKLVLGYDFNMPSAHWISDKSHFPFHVDGHMDSDEQQASTLTATKNQNGMLLTHPHGFSLASYMDWHQERNSKVAFHYVDDSELQAPMDRIKGRLPDSGYKVTNLPEDGLLGFVVSIFFNSSFTGKPQSIANKIRYTPEIKVNYHSEAYSRTIYAQKN